MRVRFHAAAEEELAASVEWYEAQRPGLGTALLDEIGYAVATISEAPSRWPSWPGVDPRLGIRRFVLPRFPYSLAYAVRGDDVIVLAVAHARRRPGYWRGRTGR